ncbi:MAG: enoyl-CoA hydratase/isomerase family protein [Gammaproteobacteria bacterium]|tara:strand:+ start:757 stop:1590 length:834 start_codon:yes stop_codon:yes gene_type:complete
MVDKFKHLRIVDEGQIVTCYLSNPPTHTLTAEGVIEIHKFLDIMEAKKDLRVLAFTGDGDEVFIKHYEVGELAETAEKNLNKTQVNSDPKELHGFHRMLLRLRDLDAIVIAGINGNTAGGGCEFSLGCDLRIMSDGDYKIGLPETSVGILPGGGGTQRLARLIGASRALDLILHARLLTPHEAESFGIINKIIPHKNFHEGLNHYCQDIANRAPIALSQVKKIIHKGLDMTLEEGLLLEQKAFDITMNSEDAAQAMRALLTAEENIEDVSKFTWKGK